MIQRKSSCLTTEELGNIRKNVEVNKKHAECEKMLKWQI